MSLNSQLLVNRSSIGECALHRVEAVGLDPAHIRVAVERFSLTANTLTYAQFGDMLDYWNFFPTSARAGWGLVPAIGYGRVVESRVDGISEGERYFGWFPMAETVDFAAVPTGSGFRDNGAHRSAHAGTYRSFLRTDSDPSYTSPSDEDRHLLLRGLYLTGFLIDAFFGARDYLGASQVVVLSASSKTALGYASAIRQAGSRPVRVVGVTSAANKDLVQSVGLYDEVILYDEVGSVSVEPTAIVDMAGSGAAVAALHQHLGDAIVHSMIVGKSHHDAAAVAVVGGPQPAMFFAPTAMADGETAWGSDEFARRTQAGIASFVDHSRGWLHVEQHFGPAAALDAWTRLFSGGVAPSVGVIASMGLASGQR
jgi:hypothetical protein